MGVYSKRKAAPALNPHFDRFFFLFRVLLSSLRHLESVWTIPVLPFIVILEKKVHHHVLPQANALHSGNGKLVIGTGDFIRNQFSIETDRAPAMGTLSKLYRIIAPDAHRRFAEPEIFSQNFQPAGTEDFHFSFQCSADHTARIGVGKILE